jgi:ribonuclease HI
MELGGRRVGAATILTSPSGNKLQYAARLQFSNEADKCTKNIIEYEAVLLGLRKLWAIGVQRCILHIDSKVVARQIEKECIARELTIEKFLSMVRRIDLFSRGFTIEYIDRNKIFEADDSQKS